MKTKFKSRIAALLSLSLVSIASFGVAATYAAYMVHEYHNHKIVINMDYSKYFGGGTGEETTPYLIKTPQHLINLSKLVNMGMFGPQHFFRIENNIDFANQQAIQPIGSTSFPFSSHLSGVVKDSKKPWIVPVISNLKIEATGLSDVGMFGYISSRGYISNFVLQNLKVTSLNKETTYTYDYQKIDNNPIRNLNFFDAQGNAMNNKFTKNGVSVITLTEGAKSSSKVKAMTDFTIDLSKLPAKYQFDNEKLDLVYNLELSDETYIKSDPSGSDVANGLYHFKAPKASAPNKETKGKYAVLDIFTNVLYKNEKGQNRISRITVEKYKFYYDFACGGVICDPKHGKIYKKTIAPAIEVIKGKEGKFVGIDNTSAIFVGGLAGRLDGVAENIAINVLDLDIRHPFISNSLIVGRAIDDDEQRTLSKEKVDVPKSLGTAKDFTYRYIPRDYIGYEGDPKVYDPDYQYGSRFIKDIYNNDTGLTPQAQNTIRFYTGHNPHAPNDGSGDGNASTQYDGVGMAKVNVVTGSVKDEQNNVSSDGQYLNEADANIHYQSTPFADRQSAIVPAISFTKEKKSGLMEYKRVGINKGGYPYMFLQNLLSFWVSAADGKGTTERIFANGIDFYLSFEFDYLLFTADYDTVLSKSELQANPEGKGISNIELDVQGVRKSLAKTTVSSIFGGSIEVHYDNSIDGTEIVRMINGTDKRGYVPDRLQTEAERKNSKSGFPFGYIGDIVDPNTNTVSQTGDQSVIFTKEQMSGNMIDAQNKKKSQVKTRKIEIKPDTASIFENANINATTFFPMFLLGILDTGKYQNPEVPDTQFEFDIVGMRVTLSDIHGNVDSSIGKIDFSKNTQLPMNNKGEWNSTSSKVSAKTLRNVKEDYATEANARSHQTFVDPSATNGFNTYTIHGYREYNTMYVTYVIKNKNQQPTTYVIPRNTEGFKPAQISMQ